MTQKRTSFWRLNLRLSRRWLWRWRFSGLYYRKVRREHDVSEEHIASVFKWECFCWFLAWFTFRPWRCRRNFPPKRRVLFEPHGVTTQKAVLFSFSRVPQAVRGCQCGLWTTDFCNRRATHFSSSRSAVLRIRVFASIRMQGHFFFPRNTSVGVSSRVTD
jgi:hypothetical protein